MSIFPQQLNCVDSVEVSYISFKDEVVGSNPTINPIMVGVAQLVRAQNTEFVYSSTLYSVVGKLVTPSAFGAEVRNDHVGSSPTY